MTSAVFPERTPVSLRPLAVPAEHGGWGFLFEPIVLGLLVAPSNAGALIALGVVAAFLARHPLKLAAQDWTRHRRHPRTRACQVLALVFGSASCGFLVGAAMIAGWRPLVALAAALPFTLTQFFYDVRSRGRGFIPQAGGAIAFGAVATAIALATRSVSFAAVLWLLMLARAIPSVMYVRSTLRGTSRATMILAHVVAIAVAAAFGPITSAVAMSLLLIRALPSTNGIPARAIGLREIGWGAVTVALIAIGYYIE